VPASILPVYVGLVTLILLGWAAAMQLLQWWDIYRETWPLALTMVPGSFIAGATAEGGGAVAFPVFTKAFGVASQDAKLFALMIQSVGMTMAALTIRLRRIPVLGRAIALALPGGIIGLVLGDLLLVLPEPYPKLFFSLVAAVFGLFLIYNRWVLRHAPHARLPHGGRGQDLLLILAGVLGGLVTAVIGVGIDMLLFIVLTLLYGIDEKISTPTTVALMGLLSVVGFLWHALVRQHIAVEVWQFWMSAVPIVVFGAPLGVWVCSRLARDGLLYLLLLLIALDLASTLWLIPLDAARLTFLLVCAVISGLLFTLLLWLRQRAAARLAVPDPVLPAQALAVAAPVVQIAPVQIAPAGAPTGAPTGAPATRSPPASPSAWVQRWAGLVPVGGRVLDLACGNGRHARYLAVLGHPVLAVDRVLPPVPPDADPAPDSDPGRGLAIDWQRYDLEAHPWPFPAGTFAGIIVVNYLHRPLFEPLLAALAPGGVLIYETFSVGQPRYGRPRNPDFLLGPGELLERVRGRLHVIAYEDLDEPARRRCVQRLCARRPLEQS